MAAVGMARLARRRSGRSGDVPPPRLLAHKDGLANARGDHSYQVCLGCGIKRLFDEKKFRGYGPYGYDAKELIAREQAVRIRHRRKPA